MSAQIKILAILLCALFCAAGAIFSLNERANGDRAKTRVVPIDNRAKQQKFWLWA